MLGDDAWLVEYTNPLGAQPDSNLGPVPFPKPSRCGQTKTIRDGDRAGPAQHP